MTVKIIFSEYERLPGHVYSGGQIKVRIIPADDIEWGVQQLQWVNESQDKNRDRAKFLGIAAYNSTLDHLSVADDDEDLEDKLKLCRSQLSLPAEGAFSKLSSHPVLNKKTYNARTRRHLNIDYGHRSQIDGQMAALFEDAPDDIIQVIKTLDELDTLDDQLKAIQASDNYRLSSADVLQYMDKRDMGYEKRRKELTRRLTRLLAIDTTVGNVSMFSNAWVTPNF